MIAEDYSQTFGNSLNLSSFSNSVLLLQQKGIVINVMFKTCILIIISLNYTILSSIQYSHFFITYDIRRLNEAVILNDQRWSNVK